MNQSNLQFDIEFGIEECTWTYANGLKVVIQNQLLPKSGTVIVRTRATLARLMQVQKVSNAAWPRLGTIMPSNLHSRIKTQHRNEA